MRFATKIIIHRRLTMFFFFFFQPSAASADHSILTRQPTTGRVLSYSEYCLYFRLLQEPSSAGSASTAVITYHSDKLALPGTYLTTQVHSSIRMPARRIKSELEKFGVLVQGIPSGPVVPHPPFSSLSFSHFNYANRQSHT